MPNHSASEWRTLQRELNHFLRDKTLGYPAIKADGEPGPATLARILVAKELLGYVKSRRTGKDRYSWGDELLWRLRNPRKTHASSKAAPFKVDKAAVARGKARRAERRKAVIRNHTKAVVTSGVTRYDGVPVAACAVFYLDYARHHGWGGHLVSGWRDPVYSRGLCIRMCGQPTCSGRCAGLSSNHVGSTLARFALDVSDYATFGRIMANMPAEHLGGRPRLHNYLGAQDPVHFSPSGR